MSAAVIQLLANVEKLTAAERYEFLSMIAAPASSSEDEWSDDDFSRVAAQTFARIDAEEENAASDPTTR